MLNHGFIRVASASPLIKVADVDYNTTEIIKLITNAEQNKISVLVFPELCITGYTCGDLFFQNALLEKCLDSILELKEFSKGKDIIFVVGSPIKFKNSLYNCAVTISNGKILGIVPKLFLPNYSEFYEERWFASPENFEPTEITIDNEIIPFGIGLLFQHQKYTDLCIGMEICEDLWTPLPPSTIHTLNGATIILNLSASNDLVGKDTYRKSLISQQSARTISSYVYSSCGFGESTTDVVFDGHCMIYENGTLLGESDRFNIDSKLIYADVDVNRLVNDRTKMTTFNNPHGTQTYNYKIIPFNISIDEYTIERSIDQTPFVPSSLKARSERCEEIFSIQTFGLAKRLSHIGCDKVVVGISGGLDSTLALLVCAMTYDLLKKDRKNIIGVTMPGFGTTDRTYNNAIALMNYLGITIKEISIKDACIQHFKDIDHDVEIHDLTYENSQARERTQILMDIATKEKGFVVGTGDLSELALGWATYNGDHMSMYAVNSSIPKTLVRYLVNWVANNKVNAQTKEILLDILDTPVSPELLPPDHHGKIAQKTEEVVGPYELHDFFLYYLIRFGFSPSKIAYLAKESFKNKYSNETIIKWLTIFYKRFFSQQFKRSCIPDGPKVGSICLSPRGDWRMPSDAVSKLWLDEVSKLS